MDEERTLSDKLSGRFRRPEDAGGKTILHARILRSPLPIGRIARIELPPMDGGIVAMTSRDIPGPIKTIVGGAAIPLLTSRPVSWEGQPIIAAAGPNLDEVDRWLDDVVLDLRPVDDSGVSDAEEYRFEKGDPAGAFSRSFQVFEETIVVPPTSSKARSSCVACLRDGRTFTVHATTAWPALIRRMVSRALKVDRESIKVRAYPPGPGPDSIASLWEPALDSTLASLLAWKAKKSVRYARSAADHQSFGSQWPGGEFHIRGAVDAGGRLLALETHFTVFAGARLPFETAYVERIVLGLFGITPCRNYSITGRVRHDARAPSRFGPAAGFELGALAGELLTSRISENVLTSPGQWRRESFPVRGQPVGPGLTPVRNLTMPAVLDAVLSASDFERKNAAFEQTRLARERLAEAPEFFRGAGLSATWFGNGFSSGRGELTPASVSMTLNTSGELLIDMPLHGTGGELHRYWSDRAASILGLSADAVNFSLDRPRRNPDQGPSILGRSVTVSTRLVELAGNELAKRRFRDPLPITVTRNRRRSGKAAWDAQAMEGAPFETVSWGAAVVEVEVSNRTGRITSIRCWLSIDGGALLFPEYAASAAETSVQNAVEWCLGDAGPAETFIDIRFYKPSGKRPPRDVSTLPWLTIPAALLRAVRQATGLSVDRLPVGPLVSASRGETR